MRITNRRGKPAKRDIVQFVPMHEFFAQNRNTNITNYKFNQEVLQEIPRQVVDFYAGKQIIPQTI